MARLTLRIAAVAIAAAISPGVHTAWAAGADLIAGTLTQAPQTGALYKSDGSMLYRSDDGGNLWTKAPFAPPASKDRITGLAVSAGAEAVLYVAGPGVGVLRSRDAGKTWDRIDQALPSREVTAFATHSTVADTLYAVVAGQGIYRSEDGGARWRMVDKGPDSEIRQLTHSSLEGSMQTGWLFATTDKGVYRSMDCLCGWRPTGSLPGPVAAVAYDPARPAELYAAVGREVFRSTDGGEAWRPAGSADARIAALAHSSAGVLYALLTDGRIARSRDKGRQWE